MKQWWDHSWKWPECSLGILLILLGLIALFLPGMILGVLSLALGIPILVFGAVQIVRSVRLYKMMGALPMPMLLTGVIAAVVGLAFLVYPSMPASVFGTIFGIWALGSCENEPGHFLPPGGRSLCLAVCTEFYPYCFWLFSSCQSGRDYVLVGKYDRGLSSLFGDYFFYSILT